jgi:ubiquitin carboxyl-terminal hydrolase 8
MLNLNVEGKYNSNHIVFQLQKIFYCSSREYNSISLNPSSFKKLIGKKNEMWAEIEHQDSQEFLTFLISVCEEELGNKIEYMPNLTPEIKDYFAHIKNPMLIKKIQRSLTRIYMCKILALKYTERSYKNDYSKIKEFFIGTSTTSLTCSKCLSTSPPNFDSFIALPIDIPIKKKTKINEIFTLEQCLDSVIKDEKLDQDNMVTCGLCSEKNQSIKKFMLWKLPKYLIFQIKRFIVNRFGIPTSKIINPVQYPLEINIKKYVDNFSPYKNNSNYRLLAVNIHQEIGHFNINAGHYVSIVKNNFDQKWYLFNDSLEPVPLNENQLQDRNAYLLFYEKID